MTIRSAPSVPEGIYTPIPTFYKSQKFAVDFETTVKHAQMLHKAGITGLVVSGSMGESTNLTLQERCNSLKSIRDAIPDPNFKLIAGVPPSNVADVIAESQLAADNGADFLIVLVPGYFGPNLVNQQGIVDYFQYVASGSALPIIIYNYPNTCNNVNINIETFATLSQHPNIVGVKLTHYNFDMYTLLGYDSSFEANNFRSFTGLGQVLVPSLSVNLFGTIDGLSGIFPKSMVKLYQLYRAGQYEEAATLQFLVTRVDLMITELNMLGVKHALNQIYGFGECHSGRPPLSKAVNLTAYNKYAEDIKRLLDYEQKL